MTTIDIYDEEKISRMLHVQKVQNIDFIKDIDWSRGIDLSKGLLPLDQNSLFFPDANEEEKLAISQLMGLIVASTISELETIAINLKGPTWETIMNKYPVNPEIRELGELFYEDEHKHSEAFKKYIELFALKLNVDPVDLKKFLPTSKSITKKFYEMNTLCGGRAMWWLIAAVEEESILIFNRMRGARESIDPLYYEIHKAHYEEEIRHKSYASIMLQIHNDFSHAPMSRIFKKIDFFIAEILNITWTFAQLAKVNGLKSLKDHHPFFETIGNLDKVLRTKSSLETLRILFNQAPYTKDMLNLSDHKNIKLMLEHYGAVKVPFSLKGIA